MNDDYKTKQPDLSTEDMNDIEKDNLDLSKYFIKERKKHEDFVIKGKRAYKIIVNYLNSMNDENKYVDIEFLKQLYEGNEIEVNSLYNFCNRLVEKHEVLNNYSDEFIEEKQTGAFYSTGKEEYINDEHARPTDNIYYLDLEFQEYKRMYKTKESLADVIIRIARENNKTFAEVNRGSELQRQILSRLTGVNPTKAKKRTLLQMMFGLECTIKQAEELLAANGNVFEFNDDVDLAVRYCLEEKLSFERFKKLLEKNNLEL